MLSAYVTDCHICTSKYNQELKGCKVGVLGRFAWQVCVQKTQHVLNEVDPQIALYQQAILALTALNALCILHAFVSLQRYQSRECLFPLLTSDSNCCSRKLFRDPLWLCSWRVLVQANSILSCTVS